MGSLVTELAKAGLPGRGGMGGGGSISRGADDGACDIEDIPGELSRVSIPWIAEIIFSAL